MNTSNIHKSNNQDMKSPAFNFKQPYNQLTLPVQNINVIPGDNEVSWFEIITNTQDDIV
jgi:hypothetical protein